MRHGRPRERTRVLLQAAAAAACAAVCASARAEAPATIDPAALKAAFIYNIALFTEWPETTPAAGDFRLCVDQASPLRSALAGLGRRTLQGRELRVAVLPPDSGELARCQVWVTPPAREGGVLVPLLPGLLVVADQGELAEGGAPIVLVQEGEQVRFDINTQAAAAVGLGFSSKLLRLARRVW